MGKLRTPPRRKRATKKARVSQWHLPHLMVAAGILVALIASIPVGAYLKASVLVAQDAGTQPPPPPPGNPPPPPPGDQPPPPPPVNNPPPATGTMPPPTNTQPPMNMAPCAPGQMPTPTAPCMMQSNTTMTQPTGMATIWCQQLGRNVNTALECPGMTQNPTGTVPTMSYCNGVGMGWDAINSRCTGTSTMTPGATNTNPTADCWNETNFARHSSATCTAARAAASVHTQNQGNLPACAPGQYTSPSYPCRNDGATPAQTGDPCWNPANASFASAECTAARAKQNDSTMTTWCPNLNRMATANECSASTKVNMNMQPCPTFPTPNGMATSMAPCGAGSMMPFQQPVFDASQFRMQNGPQFNFDYNQLNKDWNVDLTQTILPQMDFSKQQTANEVRRLAQQGKQILSQLKQMTNEVDRVVKRSGNLTACPPIAKAQAGISTAQSLAQLLVSATADNLTQALAAEKQLGMGGMGGGMGGPMQGPMPMGGGFGGPGNFGPQGNFGPSNFNGGFGPQGGFGGPGNFGGGFNGPRNFGPQSSAIVAQSEADMSYMDPQDTIMFKLQQAVGQSHMCEGITFFAKDGKRFVDDIDRMFKQTKDADTLGKLTALKVRVQALVNDPYSRVDFEDMMGGQDLMQDLMFEMQDLRQEFAEIMESFQHSQEERGVCGTLESISQGLAMMQSQVPADLFGKATRLVTAGLSSCKAGDKDKARDSLSSLERLKSQFAKHTTFHGEEDEDFEMDNEDEDEGEDLFGDLDPKSLLKTQGLDDDVINKIADRLLAKMQNRIDAAVNAATQPLLRQIATLESKFATDGALATRQAASLEYTAALPEKIQNAVAGDREEILKVVAPLDTTVNEVSKQLSATVQDQYKRLLDNATTRTCSAAGCEEIKKAIDAVNTAAESETTSAGRAKILAQEIPTALATVDQILKSDKDAAFKEGRLAFKDIDESQWHGKFLAEAKDKGLFTGDTANADRATNVAEGVAILARAAAGGSENVGTNVDLNNPFVRQMPEWARASATFLIAERGVDLAGIMGNKGADKPMTRIEMVRAAAGAFDLSATDADAASKFRDAGSLAAPAREALAALAEAGVVSGQGTTGNFDPNGTLNRAAFVKITLGAEAAAE